ncbi:MAG: molybdopterin dinucleotide binding domain-containing protein [Candidatus Bathyarchaeia archaeon]
MKVQLITGRSLGQGRGKEKGKYSLSYLQSTSVCELDPEDLKTLRLAEDENLLVETEYGQVVLKPVPSTQAPHRGIAFIPYGPWANRLTGPQTQGSGMPNLKGVSARIIGTKAPVTPL